MTIAVASPVTQYAESVTLGVRPAGELVRLACQRHLDDLQRRHGADIYFDERAADDAIEFFSLLRHSKGEWAGTAFELADWQQFIVGSIFGWKRADGTRRFRTAYNEVARKNGKSTLSAGIGLYLAFFDGEGGAEVYSAATKRDQAKIVWSEAKRMVKATPELNQMITSFSNNLHVETTASKFEPLGADADTMDGLNIHGAIVDELHAHKDRRIVDVLETATSARRQPLIFYITTAGVDQTSVCYEFHTYAKQVLSGSAEDDSLFAFIATIDEGDDWQDEDVWYKANPNLDVSVKVDDLRSKAERAKAMPAQQNAFLRLHLDVWTQQHTRWIDLNLWDENAQPLDETALVGRDGYGGLDLAAVSDLTAWVMAFPRPDDPEYVDLVCRFWCPERRLNDSSNRYRDQYRAWAQQGYLMVTPGDATDYGSVREDILRDAERFRIVDLNVDRLFQAHQLSSELENEGMTVFGMGQGYVSMASPVAEFHRRLLSRKLNHGGNPVLRWMADGVVVKQDPAGNLKPDKANSQSKIDGIVAAIMALDRCMRHQSGQKKSVYDSRGLATL